jgi:hypothetical protein
VISAQIIFPKNANSREVKGLSMMVSLCNQSCSQYLMDIRL